MKEQLTLRPLTDVQRQLAYHTISPWSFFYLVADALVQRSPLSVVRMGDGEVKLLNSCRQAMREGRLHEVVGDFDEEWRVRLGVEGITYGHLFANLRAAGDQSTFFAPNVNGLTDPNFSLYSLFAPRPYYVDNFFVNVWTDEAIAQLYQEAGHVLFVHASRGLADAIQIRLQTKLGVKVTYLELNHWSQGTSVVEQAASIQAPLVLFSGGPALKYLAVEFDKQGKVALDIGNSAEKWSLPALQ